MVDLAVARRNEQSIIDSLHEWALIEETIYQMLRKQQPTCTEAYYTVQRALDKFKAGNKLSHRDLKIVMLIVATKFPKGGFWV